MRALLFFVAFLIGIALTAPLERWLLPRIQRPLAEAGADLRLDSLRFALPAGLRATGVGLDTAMGGVDLDSFYIGITRAFRADACGGTLRGRIAGQSLVVDLSGVDPSRCLRIGKLALESTLEGSITIDGIDPWRPVPGPSTTARILVTSAAGIFRGVLPHAGSGGADLPLGEWEFSDLVLRATYAGGDLTVDEGHTLTNGVEWQIVGVSLPRGGARGGLRIDFRGRQVEDDPRSRALLGLMPKSAADAEGWHNYRVTGSMNSPRVIAVD